MDLFYTLTLCSIMLSNQNIQLAPNEHIIYSVSKHDCEVATNKYAHELTKITLSDQDRIAIAKVAYAEARNQGEEGLAGVVYTILNRYISGRFGNSITAILNAKNQFEPVSKAGGWQYLPDRTQAEQAIIDTIINLAISGHLPDLTKGALFFQNPEIVANREKHGTVSKGLTHFGGSTPSAIIKNHAFYSQIKPYKNNNASAKTNKISSPLLLKQTENKNWDIYQTNSLNNKKVFD